MSKAPVNKQRRYLLGAIASIASAISGGNAVARVMFRNPEPEPVNKEPVEVDISKLESGQLLNVRWQDKPVWILRRTEKNTVDLSTLNNMLTDPDSTVDKQPDYAKNPLRSIRPDIAVLLGICTHLGCSPNYRPDIAPEDIGSYWKGGFLCPCHGSRYDLAGRVFMGSPAQENLQVPPHHFLSDTLILIGESEQRQSKRAAES